MIPMYYVWRRSDGWVNASNGMMPRNEGTTTFEKLLATTDWPTAKARIEEEHERDMEQEQIAASWDNETYAEPCGCADYPNPCCKCGHGAGGTEDSAGCTCSLGG
jgi:hypothetical protein